MKWKIFWILVYLFFFGFGFLGQRILRKLGICWFCFVLALRAILFEKYLLDSAKNVHLLMNYAILTFIYSAYYHVQINNLGT